MKLKILVPSILIIFIGLAQFSWQSKPKEYTVIETWGASPSNVYDPDLKLTLSFQSSTEALNNMSIKGWKFESAFGTYSTYKIILSR